MAIRCQHVGVKSRDGARQFAFLFGPRWGCSTGDFAAVLHKLLSRLKMRRIDQYDTMCPRVLHLGLGEIPRRDDKLLIS